MEYDVCVREVSYNNVFVEANSKKEAAALAKAMVDHREVTAPYSITIEAEEGDAEKVFSPKTTEAETKTEAASCEAQERLMAQAKERRLEPKPCRTFGPMDGLRTELSGQASVIPTLEERDKALEVLWDEFGDIPMDPETEEMEDIFLSFPAGTPRMDIWRWFDERYSKGVGALLYGDGTDRTAELAALVYRKQLCTECDAEFCVFNPEGICMLPFVTRKAPRLGDDGCEDYTAQEDV